MHIKLVQVLSLKVINRFKCIVNHYYLLFSHPKVTLSFNILREDFFFPDLIFCFDLDDLVKLFILFIIRLKFL